MVVTNKNKFNKKYGFPLNAPHSKKEISKLSGVSMSVLNKVYDRGLGARKNNPGSVRNLKGVKGGPGTKMSGPQWAMARIYSYVMKGKTYYTADKDLHTRK
tara:strand:+ start:2125 stop:2427 length:303 start_codon:yes stop_codon:yes gene_type:complete